MSTVPFFYSKTQALRLLNDPWHPPVAREKCVFPYSLVQFAADCWLSVGEICRKEGSVAKTSCGFFGQHQIVTVTCSLHGRYWLVRRLLVNIRLQRTETWKCVMQTGKYNLCPTRCSEHISNEATFTLFLACVAFLTLSRLLVEQMASFYRPVSVLQARYWQSWQPSRDPRKCMDTDSTTLLAKTATIFT